MKSLNMQSKGSKIAMSYWDLTDINLDYRNKIRVFKKVIVYM